MIGECSASLALSQPSMSCVREVVSNLVLVGGSSLFINFKARLQAAILDTCPHVSKKLKVHSSPQRHAAWLGGSAAAAGGMFAARWVSREEYLEHGATVFRARCL